MEEGSSSYGDGDGLCLRHGSVEDTRKERGEGMYLDIREWRSGGCERLRNAN
jgi:hypothetical protein